MERAIASSAVFTSVDFYCYVIANGARRQAMLGPLDFLANSLGIIPILTCQEWLAGVLLLELGLGPSRYLRRVNGYAPYRGNLIALGTVR